MVFNVINTNNTAAIASYHICDDGTYIWIAGGNNFAYQFRKSDLVLMNTITGATTTRGIYSNGVNVYVASSASPGYIYIAPVSSVVGAVTTFTSTIIPPGGGALQGMCGNGQYVWAITTNNVYKYTISGNTLIDYVSFSTGGGYSQVICVDSKYIWIANGTTNNVSRFPISATTGATPTLISLPASSNPYGIYSDGTYVWTANNGLGSVSQINISTGTVVSTTPAGSANGPRGIASDGTYVYVANTADWTISQYLISPTSLTLIERFSKLSSPLNQVVLDSSYIWVSGVRLHQMQSFLGIPDGSFNQPVTAVASDTTSTFATSPSGSNLYSAFVPGWTFTGTASALNLLNGSPTGTLATSTIAAGQYAVSVQQMTASQNMVMSAPVTFNASQIGDYVLSFGAAYRNNGSFTGVASLTQTLGVSLATINVSNIQLPLVAKLSTFYYPFSVTAAGTYNLSFTFNQTATTDSTIVLTNAYLVKVTTPFVASNVNLNNSNLVNYYPFDGYAVVGGGYNDYASGTGVANTDQGAIQISIGTDIGSTILTSGSIYFPGTPPTQFVKIPNITFGTNGITIAVWMKCASTASLTGNAKIFDFGFASSSNLSLAFRNQILYFTCLNPSSGPGTNGTQISTGYTLNDLNWHHYCLVISPGGKWALYIDGVNYILNFSSYPTLGPLTSCYIGRTNWSVDDGTINCRMNQFVVFNRAITNLELGFFLNNPSRITISSSPSAVTSSIAVDKTNMLLYYPFNVDLLNYMPGFGVSDATSVSNASYSGAETKLTNGSARFTGATTQSFMPPLVNITGNGITVAFWLKCNPVPVANQRMFDFCTTDGTDNLFLFFGASGQINLGINGPSIGSTGGYLGYALTDVSWHHYCLQINSFGNVTFYVDGVLTSNSLISYPKIQVYSNNQIMSTVNATNRTTITGNMNQFLFYNRTITASELSYLVNNPTIVQFVYVAAVPPAEYPCFLEGTRILRMNTEYDEEEYVPVEKLRAGDLVKTAMSGYKMISFIGHATLKNPANDPDPKNRLYKFSKKNCPGLLRDLYVTGEHCILHKTVPENKLQQIVEHMGDDFITEEYHRVPACLDERGEPYREAGPAKIWHFALEHDNVHWNYGVYANGLLVESCSINYLTKRSNMKLV